MSRPNCEMISCVKGTNITADTVAGLGRIKKIWGTESGIGTDKNLLNNVGTTTTINGITFTKNSDGTVVANGTATANATFTLNDFMFVKDEVYTMTNGLKDNAYGKYSLFIPTYSYWEGNTLISGSYNTFTPASTIKLPVQIIVYSGQTMNNVKFYPKLQEGTVATKWSPYDHGTIEIISKNGEQQNSNICYIKNGLAQGDYIDYSKKKVIRANGTEEDIECSDKIVQYANTTTVYNVDGAEIEVSLTNNKAIAEVNENLDKIENSETKLKTIWSGNLYQKNDSIILDKPLKQNKLYIFTFYGLSSSYLMQFPFTYKNGNFQVAYYDGSSYFRMRLDIVNNGSKINVNEDSINNATNTALISIEEV